jgi:hypothetical protein
MLFSIPVMSSVPINCYYRYPYFLKFSLRPHLLTKLIIPKYGSLSCFLSIRDDTTDLARFHPEDLTLTPDLEDAG